MGLLSWIGEKRREIGHAVAVRGFNRALSEDNGALKFPQSSVTFAQMLREDAQITAVFRAVSLPIRRANWQLESNGCDTEIVAHVAEDLRLRVRGEDPNSPVAPHSGRVSWDKHLEQLLYSLIFGHMFFEQVYAPDSLGREHLVKLAPRWPGTITRINVAEDGGLDSIEQTSSGHRSSPKIPVDHLVAYVFDDVGSQWVGRSILRPAYKHWKMRDFLLELEMKVLERNGMGIPVHTASELSNDPQGDIKRGQELVEGLRAGEYSGASLPWGADLSVKGVTGQLVSPRDAIAYHDSMIARSVMAHVLNLDGKGGAYALAETQADLFVQSLQTTAEWVQDIATQHVIEDLVRVAFPDYDGPMPILAFDPIASKKEIVPGDLAQLVNSKVIMMDAPTEQAIRRQFSLPPKQQVSEALKAKKARERIEEEMGVKLTEPATEETTPGGNSE